MHRGGNELLRVIGFAFVRRRALVLWTAALCCAFAASAHADGTPAVGGGQAGLPGASAAQQGDPQGAVAAVSAPAPQAPATTAVTPVPAGTPAPAKPAAAATPAPTAHVAATPSTPATPTASTPSVPPAAGVTGSADRTTAAATAAADQEQHTAAPSSDTRVVEQAAERATTVGNEVPKTGAPAVGTPAGTVDQVPARGAPAPTVDHTVAPAEQATAPVEHSVATAEQATAPVQHTLTTAQQATAPVEHSVATAEQATAPVPHTIATAQQATAPVPHTIATAQQATAPAQHTIATAQQATALAQHSIATAERPVAEHAVAPVPQALVAPTAAAVEPVTAPAARQAGTDPAPTGAPPIFSRAAPSRPVAADTGAATSAAASPGNRGMTSATLSARTTGSPAPPVWAPRAQAQAATRTALDRGTGSPSQASLQDVIAAPAERPSPRYPRPAAMAAVTTPRDARGTPQATHFPRGAVTDTAAASFAPAALRLTQSPTGRTAARGVPRIDPPPGPPSAPRGPSPGSAGAATSGASGSPPAGPVMVLLMGLGLAGFVLWKLLLVDEAWRSQCFVSLLERPG
jgi:hypothetical protein